MRGWRSLILLIFLFAGGIRAEVNREDGAIANAHDLPTVKLSPSLREQEWGADYYRELDCRELPSARPGSAREQRWLDERKAACVERYRAFEPRSFQR